jgi:hypothetical protein
MLPSPHVYAPSYHSWQCESVEEDNHEYQLIRSGNLARRSLGVFHIADSSPFADSDDCIQACRSFNALAPTAASRRDEISRHRYWNTPNLTVETFTVETMAPTRNQSLDVAELLWRVFLK